MDNRPIGVFDSGVGGLTVVSALRKIMPHEGIIYFGDTAHVPYGVKDRDTIIGYGREIIRFLLEHRVKAVVVACGTISSNGFSVLQSAFNEIPLMDVLNPGVSACLDEEPSGVGFIATEASVRSGAFVRLLTEKRPGLPVYAKACPLFVPLVEEGWTNNEVTRLVAQVYLEEWKDKGIDTLVLGCTHYPLLLPVLRQVMGPIRFIDMAEYTARATCALLAEKDLLSGAGQEGDCQFFVSGSSDRFEGMVEKVLGCRYQAEKVTL